MTTSSEDRETLCLDDIKFSPGDHNHNGRDRDLLDRHLDSLSMSSSSSACSALSWDSSPSVSCTAFILKKEPSEDLEEDEEHEVRPFAGFACYILSNISFAVIRFSYYAHGTRTASYYYTTDAFSDELKFCKKIRRRKTDTVFELTEVVVLWISRSFEHAVRENNASTNVDTSYSAVSLLFRRGNEFRAVGC